MLNSIGIQNPGVDGWLDTYGGEIGSLGLPVWGSAVGNRPEEFAAVAAGLSRAPLTAIEVNLSCPNLEEGGMFALDAAASASVISQVVGATSLPVGAKLSPNSEDIVAVAAAVAESGASWVTLTNTVWGAAIDIERRRPAISGVIGGYSGVALKPIALRCVIEVRRAIPDLPILGLGGVRTGGDVVEYVMAGASAVGVGTVHFEDPKVGARIISEVRRWMSRHGVDRLADLEGVAL